MKEKSIWEIAIEGLNWEKKNFYKKNKNEIRNQKSDDWNWKTKNKKQKTKCFN
jgi:hypothetical protein